MISALSGNSMIQELDNFANKRLKELKEQNDEVT